MNNQTTIAQKWFCIKAAFLFFWLANLYIMLISIHNPVLSAVGIIGLYSFNPLFSAEGKVITGIAMLVLSVLYLLEKHMLWITFLQFVSSVVIISRHESGGMFNHATVYSVLFAAQFLAYILKHLYPTFKLTYYRVQYSIQIIVAMYMLAGISKLTASGWGWINSGALFALQIVKNYSFVYYANGNEAFWAEGLYVANQFISNKGWIQFILGSSLLLELGSFCVLYNSRVRKVYALALFSMHVGIKVIMAIPFGVIAPVMIIFFINPIYELLKLSQSGITFLRSEK